MGAPGILPVVPWEALLHDDAVNDKQYGFEVDSSYRCPEAWERMRFPKAVVIITTPTATVTYFVDEIWKKTNLKNTQKNDHMDILCIPQELYLSDRQPRNANKPQGTTHTDTL